MICENCGNEIGEGTVHKRQATGEIDLCSVEDAETGKTRGFSHRRYTQKIKKNLIQ
jgi:hypothetical protein